MKTLLWMGSSKADLLMFPGDARRDAGFQLRKVQRGADPSDWKNMPTIGGVQGHLSGLAR
jgi:phage-related protein